MTIFPTLNFPSKGSQQSRGVVRTNQSKIKVFSILFIRILNETPQKKGVPSDLNGFF